MSTPSTDAPLSGRRAQAARNDAVILAAAREVFMAAPDAPVAAVAQAAGVGISALYRRYPSKEELLATLCLDGLRRFVEVARAALDVADPWDSFENFLRGIVEADVHSLTVHLAGRFTPTPDHYALAEESGGLAAEILRRAQDAGVVRSDVVDADLPMIYEQLAGIRIVSGERLTELRRRYLKVHLAGLRADALEHGTLPGDAPSSAELGARWRRA
jgi:AcrR family transcriptional regulator